MIFINSTGFCCLCHATHVGTHESLRFSKGTPSIFHDDDDVDDADAYLQYTIILEFWLFFKVVDFKNACMICICIG